jgi:hypothetical protein
VFKLTVEGTEYEFDGDRMLLAEAREIKVFAKMTVPVWSQGHRRDGPGRHPVPDLPGEEACRGELRYSDLDTLDLADITLEPMDDEEEEGEPEAVAQTADPTPPGETGTTPTPGTTDTSEPSPTTSSTAPETSSV